MACVGVAWVTKRRLPEVRLKQEVGRMALVKVESLETERQQLKVVHERRQGEGWRRRS